MPYALASGLFRPGSADSRGVLRYLLTHGSRLLGMVRAAGFALYKTPSYPVSGTDQVYGLNVARFLADEDEADQLVLSLYGQLVAGMTPGTFVAGEAASVAPLGGALHRSMYLPPNSTSNAAFLETLRVMLVHERRGPDGQPRGLELAYSTPRAWLAPGRRIRVDRLPTSFGPLTYELDAGAGEIRGTVAVPSRRAAVLAAAPSAPAGRQPARRGSTGRAAVDTIQCALGNDRPLGEDGHCHVYGAVRETLDAGRAQPRSWGWRRS